MVKIQISDLHPNVEEQVFNEIADGEMKTVEGGVVQYPVYPYPVESYEETNTNTNTTTTLSSTLRQVNGLLDNLRLELDKLFGRLG